MDIRTVVHRGLKRLIENDDPSALDPAVVAKIRNIVSFLQVVDNIATLTSRRLWGIHPLKGKRKGTWSLHVTANWRITFRVDAAVNEIVDLDLEDYH